MADLRQRAPRIKDAVHLAYVRSQPCSVCGTTFNVEAAHIRFACPARGKPETGMQQKPDDKWSAPLCAYHHRTGVAAQHKMGEADFWRMIGRDPFEIALRLWAESGGEDRVVVPVKRAKKVKVRAGPARQIVGRGFSTAQEQRSASRPIERHPHPTNEA